MAAYEKLNLKNGVIMTANHVEHIENGIQTVEKNISDVSNALSEEDSKLAKAVEEVFDKVPDVESITRMTKGHFYPVLRSGNQKMRTYVDNGAGIEMLNERFGSGFVAAPKHLFMEFSDEDARLWLYFYTQNADGTYTPDWSVLDKTTSTGRKNYIYDGAITHNTIRNIPDGTYMQFAVSAGEVALYGWDGEPFGMPLSSNTAIVTSSGGTSNMYSDGKGSVVIPGNAKMIVTTAADVVFRSGLGFKDGASTLLNMGVQEFIQLPDGYEWFMFRLDIGGEKRTYTGNLADYVAVVCDTECNRKAEARARKVIAYAKKICNLEWTPAAELPVSINADGTIASSFKHGVRYNGVPYSSAWSMAHFVGWHVSPHTFVNAANDPDSVLYKERLTSSESGEDLGPYYGLVCSAFATLAAGWPYPVQNASFAIDPKVELVRSATPEIGSVWSNLGKGGDLHCVIPERVDYIGDNVVAISVYESTPPVCLRTTRYSSIKTANDISGYTVASGYAWYDKYGVSAHHLDAVADGSNIPYVPYFNTDGIAITGGDARPDRGDKSVYTADMDNVIINIKNDAKILRLTDKNGTVQNITVSGDTVDVKRYLLSGTGIYYVHTDTSEIKESFEYIAQMPEITCEIVDGKPLFNRTDWWYAYAFIIPDNNRYYTKMQPVEIPAADDYSGWQGTFDEVRCVFYKGEYGAYVVKCEMIE